MELNTKRLILIPMGPDLLRLWAEDTAALEKALGLRYEAEEVAGEFLDVVKGQLEKVARTGNPGETMLYETFWLTVLKEPRIAVGSACFKGPPGSGGRVEIGYGLGEAHRGKGYMAEAVQAMCGWALAQPGVHSVVAETEPGNTPSEQVLRRCGFTPWPRRAAGGNNWWRLKLPQGTPGRQHTK